VKRLRYLVISWAFLLNLCLSSYAQDQAPGTKPENGNELYKSVVSEYGFDQVLVNGICYEDEFPGKIGHPFLFENQFYKGNLVFRERKYEGIDLKYDIYNQQLVLYITQNNSAIWLIPPNDFISAFSLGDKLFKKYAFNGSPKFYQVIFDSKELKCLFYLSKSRYDSDHRKGYNSYKFTDTERNTYILVNEVLKKYRDNKSFIRIFPEEIQFQIKQFIKENKIKVAKSREEEMKKLLAYCKTIL
jgi:hypothetical protein